MHALTVQIVSSDLQYSYKEPDVSSFPGLALTFVIPKRRGFQACPLFAYHVMLSRKLTCPKSAS